MADHVIAIFNRKGGVGKTSLCFHLAGAWAQAGRRVLCLDMDPQASLSKALLGPAAAGVGHEQSLAALFDGGPSPRPEDLVHVGHVCYVPGKSGHVINVPHMQIDLAPASDALGRYNHTDPQHRAEQDVLALAVNEWRQAYDVILIDCPPCLQLCSWASVLAADQILVPVEPSDPGIQELPHVREWVAAAQARHNPHLRLLGYVLSKVCRNALHRGYSELLRERHPGQVLATEVPRGTMFERAVTARTPVTLHSPRSAAAKVIVALASEIDSRVAMGRAA